MSHNVLWLVNGTQYFFGRGGGAANEVHLTLIQKGVQIRTGVSAMTELIEWWIEFSWAKISCPKTLQLRIFDWVILYFLLDYLRTMPQLLYPMSSPDCHCPMTKQSRSINLGRRDWNPGQTGEKRELHLCAMLSIEKWLLAEKKLPSNRFPGKKVFRHFQEFRRFSPTLLILTRLLSQLEAASLSLKTSNWTLKS